MTDSLLTLRYSATHKKDSIYNMVYRLDAMEAYNKRLVKKIAVKGITASGSTATESYVYLQSINLSRADPTATIQFDYKGAAGIRKVTKTVGINFNLYDNSNYLDEYKEGFTVSDIRGDHDYIEFINGIRIYAGDIIGIDKKGVLTDKYYEDKANGEVQVAEEVADCRQSIVDILDSIYDAHTFDTDELIHKAIDSLNRKLKVSKIFFRVESGEMKEISSKEALLSGASMVRDSSSAYGSDTKISVNRGVKYDLIGKLVDETGLTRKAIKGKLGVNAMKAKKHLYDHIVYDSTNERDFAEQLDISDEVAVYVKLPDGFYISTPVGHYNPDWAIAFYEGSVKHIYFVAETKGSMSSMQLRLIEESKIHCAREHFKAISKGNVVYDVVDSYESLLELVRN